MNSRPWYARPVGWWPLVIINVALLLNALIVTRDWRAILISGVATAYCGFYLRRYRRQASELS